MARTGLTDRQLSKFEESVMWISRITGITEGVIWEAVKMVLIKYKDDSKVDEVLRAMHHCFGTGEMDDRGNIDSFYLKMDEDFLKEYCQRQ